MIKKIKRKSTSSKHHTTTVGPVDLVKHKSEVVTGAALLEGEVRREGGGEREKWGGGGGGGGTVREREEKEKRKEEGEGEGGEGRGRDGAGDHDYHMTALYHMTPSLYHMTRPTAYSRGL